MGVQELLMAVVAPLLLLAALIYASMSYRRRSAAAKAAGDARTRELYHRRDGEAPARSSGLAEKVAPDAMADEAAPNARALSRDKTEDEMARAQLGGVKGSRDLPPAPLTAKERANTFG